MAHGDISKTPNSRVGVGCGCGSVAAGVSSESCRQLDCGCGAQAQCVEGQPGAVRRESKRFLQKVHRVDRVALDRYGNPTSTESFAIQRPESGGVTWALKNAADIATPFVRLPYRVTVAARATSILLDFDSNCANPAGTVCAFLPLKGVSFGFPFHVNADWRTKTDRERLSFSPNESEGEWNLALLRSLSDGFRLALECVFRTDDFHWKLPLFIPLMREVIASPYSADVKLVAEAMQKHAKDAPLWNAEGRKGRCKLGELCFNDHYDKVYRVCYDAVRKVCGKFILSQKYDSSDKSKRIFEVLYEMGVRELTWKDRLAFVCWVVHATPDLPKPWFAQDLRSLLIDCPKVGKPGHAWNVMLSQLVSVPILWIEDSLGQSVMPKHCLFLNKALIPLDYDDLRQLQLYGLPEPKTSGGRVDDDERLYMDLQIGTVGVRHLISFIEQGFAAEL